jgi:predicted RNA binding protein YcfA (HicA-like mRNA interferase family)
VSQRLPTVTAKVMVRVLLRSGFEELRQKGSHRIFGKGSCRVVVPMHSGDLKPGTLKAILEAAGLSVDDLSDLL